MESRKAASEEVRLQTTAKTSSEGADVTCGGRPFQIRAAATGKVRSPMVDNRVRRTTIYNTRLTAIFQDDPRVSRNQNVSVVDYPVAKDDGD